MKKLITFIVVVLIVGGVWCSIHKQSSVSVDTSSTPTGTGSTSAGHPDASNATFMIGDSSVTLKSGKSIVPASDDSATADETDLTQTVSYGDLNGDGKEDEAVVLTDQGGGSGVFIYVAAYVSGNISYKGTNAVFVGDRVAPQSISVKNGVITLTYLDRGPNEPYAADPTIPTTKTYSFANGELSAD